MALRSHFHACLISVYGKTVIYTGHRGVICVLDCQLELNFTVDTVHRLCFYTVESSKQSFNHSINMVKYYPMLWKTTEGHDCGLITAAKI